MNSQKTNNRLNSNFNILFKPTFLFETTIFIGNSNSISSKRHCSVISIHALRVRILSQTTLSNIYKCTISCGQMFYRIANDSCCLWRHNAVSGCFQSEVNLRDTFDYVLESCTTGSGLSLSFCRVWTHSRKNLDSVVQTRQKERDKPDPVVHDSRT